MDYVLKGKPKPGLLDNNVNYEVMGANVWRHAPSLDSDSRRRAHAPVFLIAEKRRPDIRS